ncbi:MAG: DUF4142 domain-containing protein [Sphingomicrobium sp.]
MIRLRNSAWLAICLALAACSTQPMGRPADAPPPRGRPSGPGTAALSPADYVARAASIDLFVLRSSELALQRSTSDGTRNFARSMQSVHEGTSAQLAFAARRLALPTSPVLAATEQASLYELQQSPRFDETYAAQQKAVHRQALQLHDQFEARGASPTLRTVARFVTSRLRDHQQMVDAL